MVTQKNIHSLQETINTSVSVVIPILNQADYTNSILGDIAKNSVIPNQIIIINNGSTDNSKEVIDRFKGQLSIRLINLRKNIGVNASWNLGLKLSSSTYVSVLNNDIVINKQFFEIICKTFEANPNCGMLCPRTYHPLEYIEKVRKETFSGASKTSNVKWRNGWAFTVRQELIKDTLIPKELFNYCGDDFQYFKVKKLGYDILMMEQNVVFHYRGITGSTMKFNSIMHKDRECWEMLKQKLGL